MQTANGDLALRLREIFVAEAEERVRAIGDRILALERAGEPLPDVVAEVFREAHSLKGAARAAGAEPVESLAHDLEGVFARIRDGDLLPTSEDWDEAYGKLDVISILVREVAADGVDGERDRATDPAPAGGASTSETVRITTGKLDALMDQVGELLMVREGERERHAGLRSLISALDETEREWLKLRPSERPLGSTIRKIREGLAAVLRSSEADGRRMAQVTEGLQESVRGARMLAVATVFEAFPRMIRDLAREAGVEASLSITGGEVEADRAVLEELRAPLTHLIRNAVSHGLEPPDQRTAAGKPREGRVRLSARQFGSALVVEISDDGAGIDAEAVRGAAVERNVVTAEAADAVPDGEALWLAFRPGVSTSPAVTGVAGRGVGLDVVRESVERLHGTIAVESARGSGTAIRLTVPLSVTTTPSLLGRVGGHTYAFPLAALVRAFRVGPEQIRRVEGREAILVDGVPVVVVHLAALLGLQTEAPGTELGGPWVPPERLVVLGSGDRRAGFLLDDLLGVQDLVVKSLPKLLAGVRHVAGACVLGAGGIAIVLKPADLVRSALEPAGRTSTSARLAPGPEAEARRILVVDDSITSRTMERNILEAAGYRVQVAADGVEAWGLLYVGSCDLVVADIVMPGMDGLELTARIRADERFRDLPVVLVTSLASPEDRERGMTAGADAFIVKSEFDQELLLDVIRRLT